MCPWCYRWICQLLMQFNHKVTLLLWMWRSRILGGSKLIDSRWVNYNSFPVSFSREHTFFFLTQFIFHFFKTIIFLQAGSYQKQQCHRSMQSGSGTWRTTVRSTWGGFGLLYFSTFILAILGASVNTVQIITATLLHWNRRELGFIPNCKMI